MTAPKRQLFGGALFAAGVVATTMIRSAASADFDPAAPVDASGYFGNYLILAGGPIDESIVNHEAAFNTPLLASIPGLTMSAYANALAMGGSLTMTDYEVIQGFAAVICEQWFTVSRPTQVIFEWDLENISGSAGVGAYGAPLDAHAQFGTAGSEFRTLLPGHLYCFGMRLSIVGDSTEDAFGFVRLTSVPAPGGLAFFGIGLLTSRKRRRE